MAPLGDFGGERVGGLGQPGPGAQPLDDAQADDRHCRRQLVLQHAMIDRLGQVEVAQHRAAAQDVDRDVGMFSGQPLRQRPGRWHVVGGGQDSRPQRRLCLSDEVDEDIAHRQGQGLGQVVRAAADQLVGGNLPRQEGVLYTENVEHRHSRAFALAIASFFDHLAGDREKLAEHCLAAMTLAEEQGFQYLRAVAIMLHALVLGQVGHAGEAVELAQMGFRDWEASETVILRPYYRGMLTEVLWRAGRIEQAKATVAAALTDVHELGERWYEPELHRLAAAMAREQGLAEQAESSLASALQTARDQGARMWELRAARDLARLWSEQGEHQKAHDLLLPIYDWFTEGFDKPDLIDAKALLDQLS